MLTVRQLPVARGDLARSGTFRDVGTTDSQDVRAALGARLRELRSAAGLTGQRLADRLGWTQSKVSKLETGRQTATPTDLRAWAEGTGQPEVVEELLGRLDQVRAPHQPGRRQRGGGTEPCPRALRAEYQRSTVLHGWDGTTVASMLRTAEYARHLWTRRAEARDEGAATELDVEEAVRATLRHQEALYVPGKSFHILLWEAALHARVCPAPVLAAQLDRLSGIVGLDTVTLGVVPLAAPLRVSPVPAFWVHDDRLVVAGEWPGQQWHVTRREIGHYQRIWRALAASARYGTAARELLAQARRSLG